MEEELARWGKTGSVRLLFINKEDIKQNESHCERRMD
jgi:hypothetical protein